MRSFFHKLCEIIFFSGRLFSPRIALSGLFSLFSLYSTSSASSPSISRAAYLLAELNFYKGKTKKNLDQYSKLWMLEEESRMKTLGTRFQTYNVRGSTDTTTEGFKGNSLMKLI